MRNALAKVSKGHAEMVAATIRTIFTQPTGPGVRDHVESVAATLQQQFTTVAKLLGDAREDIHGVRGLPRSPMAQDLVDEPVERLNKEVKRRTDVVGCLP